MEKRILHNITGTGNEKLDLLLSFLSVEAQEGELWAEIPNTNQYYFVSSKGRVLSLYGHGQRLLTPSKTDSGYHYVQLHIDGKAKNFRVHRLVAAAFLEYPKDRKIEIHHKDRNRLNNEISNLQPLTPEQHRELHKREDTQENSGK